MQMRQMPQRIARLIRLVRRQRVIPLLAVLAIAETTAAQLRQDPLPKGTTTLRGVLTDAMTKTPVAGCSVRALSGGRSNLVSSGPDGRYEFAGVGEGIFFLRVECPEHVGACSALPNAEQGVCSEFTLFKDEQRAMDFRLTPAAVVRGRVVDGAGKPISQATVRVLRSPKPNVFPTGSVIGTTKADGSYELDKLAPGEWLIEVELPPSASTFRVPVVYYPGVFDRDGAAGVEVTAGLVKDNVTITVPPVLVGTMTVRMPPPDALMTDVNVTLIQVSPRADKRLALDADGQAIIKGLTEGRYVVSATGRWQQQTWAAFQALDFSGDPIEVPLNLQPAGRIRGRVIAERGGPLPLDGASVGAAWVDNDVTLNALSPEEANVAPDGTFEIVGVFGRRMMQLMRFEPEWTIDSVRQGKSDVTATGVEVAPNSTTEVTIVVRPRGQRYD